MRAYTVTTSEFSEQANISVDLFLAAMKKEGILTEEQVEQCKEYRIVYAPSSMWGRLWKYFTTHTEGNDYTFVVKIVNHGIREEDSD